MISAFKDMPNSNLKIAGTGPLEDELKDYTKSNNVTNVEFLGYKSGKELTDLVENAYFIIVPSEWYENNPMTIIEGYAAGVPVIGTNIGGIPEIIEEGVTGYLFTPANSVDLTRVVKAADSLPAEQYYKLSTECTDVCQKAFDRKILSATDRLL